MVLQHSKDKTLKSFQAAAAEDPYGPEASAYRMWMVEVLQPLNEKAACIVRDHIDLLEGREIVKELLQLVAHVSAQRVVLQK